MNRSLHSACALVAVLCLTCCCFTQVASARDSSAKPTRDHVVQAYPAQYGRNISDDQLDDLNHQSKEARNSPIFDLFPDTALPNGTGKKKHRIAYMIHVTRWDSVDGALGLAGRNASTWYVYEAHCPGKDPGTCFFQRVGKRTDGKTPLLYGYKTIWFIGVSHFAQAIDYNDFSLIYKISTTPTIMQGVQDFGSLVAALIGATPSTTPPAVPAAHLAAVLPSNTLLSLARISSIDSLPFIINFNYVLSLNQPGGLPHGHLGLPYSASVTVSGGNGSYTYQLGSGSLPEGLSLDGSSGAISGTPTGSGGTEEFTIDVSDQSDPPIHARIKTSITVEDGVTLDTSANGSSFDLPDAYVGQFYSSGVWVKGGSGNYTLQGQPPTGLSLNGSTGAITGVPAAVGKKSFQLTVLDSGATPPKPYVYTANIHLISAAMSFANPPAEVPLTSGGFGEDYTGGVEVTGGAPPYKYLPDGTWPGSLRIDENDGMISGVVPPFAVQSPAKLKLTISDHTGKQISTVLTLPLSYDSVELSASDKRSQRIPDGNVNYPYAEVIKVTGISSISSVEPVGGGLPKGMTIEVAKDAMFVSGTPENPGSFETTVLVNRATRLTFNFLVRKSVLTVTLGAASSAATNPGGKGPGGPQMAGPTTAAAQGPGGPAGNQGPGGPAAQGPGGPQSAAQSPQGPGGGQPQQQSGTQTGSQPIDCSAVSPSNPCNFTDSFQSDAREMLDFSIGISIPGVKEGTYPGGASASPVTVVHTDLYAFVDFDPWAHWLSTNSLNGSWPPHVNFGVPVTSQPLHRPYFGLSEPLTSWTRLEKLGFPFRINAFAGLVYMKQQILVTASGSAALESDRAWKIMYGIEVPIGPIISKISGGSGSGGAKGK